MEDKIIWALSGLVLVISAASSIIQMKSEVAHINVTLDKIAKQIGVPSIVTENIDTELRNLILEGKKIKAIKTYRMHTGIGLKEAKDYIDLLSEQKNI